MIFYIMVTPDGRRFKRWYPTELNRASLSSWMIDVLTDVADHRHTQILICKPIDGREVELLEDGEFDEAEVEPYMFYRDGVFYYTYPTNEGYISLLDSRIYDVNRLYNLSREYTYTYTISSQATNFTGLTSNSSTDYVITWDSVVTGEE